MSLWDELTREETLARPIWEWDGSTYRGGTYGELLAGARRAAAGLRGRGVKPGQVVPAVITNGPEAARALAGVWFAGGTIASLPIIARGMSDANYLRQLGRLCASLDAEWLLGDERLAALAENGELELEVIDFASLIGTKNTGELEPPPLDDVIFIQFSSGTTGEPRGVELTGRAIERQLRALADREEIDPERDVGGSWLPMSHDMGFFGAFLARGWYSGISAFRSTPERFLRNPQSWLDDCGRFGATVTGAPPFALSLAARAEKLRPSNARVALRLCLVGAESINWSALASSAAALSERGLTMGVLTPAYGLAEATLAVTVDDPNAEPRYADVELEEGVERPLVSCGTPLAGVGVRIDEQSGEIVVSGPTLASGYHRNPDATRARFRDGELWTGDLGVMRDGELYVIGRTDDVLIVGGRNIHVTDIETALGDARGVRKGNCALVDVPGQGGMRVALVAELDGEAGDARELSIKLGRTSMDAAGLPIDRYVFLAKGAFPKTPSGKPQRYRCRAIAQHPDAAAEVVNLGTEPAGS
jgi:fatty-acyl-CoA synthase